MAKLNPKPSKQSDEQNTFEQTSNEEIAKLEAELKKLTQLY